MLYHRIFSPLHPFDLFPPLSPRHCVYYITWQRERESGEGRGSITCLYDKKEIYQLPPKGFNQNKFGQFKRNINIISSANFAQNTAGPDAFEFGQIVQSLQFKVLININLKLNFLPYDGLLSFPPQLCQINNSRNVLGHFHLDSYFRFCPCMSFLIIS